MGRFARAVLGFDLLAVTIAGVQLFVYATRTADYFAWTIGAPITAAFFGAGFWSSIPSILIGIRAREWQNARTLLVMGVILTSVSALATFSHLGEFHLDSGPTSARLAAWTWVVVYIAVPLMLLAAIVRQERAGGAREYAVEAPLRPWVRAILLVHAVPLSALGMGLLFWPDVFGDAWPWPLPALPAGAAAAWLLTVAAGCWWSLREGDWRRIRVAFPSYILFAILLLIGAARFSEALDPGDVRTWVYIGALIASPLLFALAAWRQEAALRASP